MKARAFNFGGGPAMLPLPVLEAAQAELLNWEGRGLSILELGHRSPEFIELLEKTQGLLSDLLHLPNQYQILFLGGAARTQFASIPLNLLDKDEQAAYLISGVWSKMAFEEAKRLREAYAISAESQGQFYSTPAESSLSFHPNTAYVYYTPNETVNGIRFPYLPKSMGHPLIADMTSCLLSEPFDMSQYALVFAGAQKNLANAGLTLVIIRNDLLETCPASIPTMMNFKIQAEHHSLYATPPVFNCYLAYKMCLWVKERGGVEALYQENCLKAQKLYQFLDAHPFYRTSVAKEARSLLNVCFSLSDLNLETQFLEEAREACLIGLKGHRLVGGLRASLYNAMPMAGVDALIAFMSQFQNRYAP